MMSWGGYNDQDHVSNGGGIHASTSNELFDLGANHSLDKILRDDPLDMDQILSPISNLTSIGNLEYNSHPNSSAAIHCSQCHQGSNQLVSSTLPNDNHDTSNCFVDSNLFYRRNCNNNGYNPCIANDMDNFLCVNGCQIMGGIESVGCNAWHEYCYNRHHMGMNNNEQLPRLDLNNLSQRQFFVNHLMSWTNSNLNSSCFSSDGNYITFPRSSSLPFSTPSKNVNNCSLGDGEDLLPFIVQGDSANNAHKPENVHTDSMFTSKRPHISTNSTTHTWRMEEIRKQPLAVEIVQQPLTQGMQSNPSIHNQKEKEQEIKKDTGPKRKQGRPKKSNNHKIPVQRSKDRSELTFSGWYVPDAANVRSKTSTIRDPNPDSKAKGFQRGGVRTEFKEMASESLIADFYNKPPEANAAYARIRVWKDCNDRKYYDCICNCRKPVQDLTKIKRHVLSHDQGSFQCDICGRLFHKNHLQLNAHKKTHKPGHKKRKRAEMEKNVE